MAKQQQEGNLQTLPGLPIKLSRSQCVSFPYNNNKEEELLICGGYNNNNCYSYHIQKQQYKFICSYPENIKLNGHRVIDYHLLPYSSNFQNHHYRDQDAVNNNNNINTFTLLS